MGNKRLKQDLQYCLKSMVDRMVNKCLQAIGNDKLYRKTILEDLEIFLGPFSNKMAAYLLNDCLC